MAANVSGSGNGSQDQASGEKKPVKSEIDLHALAERILKLMKEEARLERERLGRQKK